MKQTMKKADPYARKRKPEGEFRMKEHIEQSVFGKQGKRLAHRGSEVIRYEMTEEQIEECRQDLEIMVRMTVSRIKAVVGPKYSYLEMDDYFQLGWEVLITYYNINGHFPLYDTLHGKIRRTIGRALFGNIPRGDVIRLHYHDPDVFTWIWVDEDSAPFPMVCMDNNADILMETIKSYGIDLYGSWGIEVALWWYGLTQVEIQLIMSIIKGKQQSMSNIYKRLMEGFKYIKEVVGLTRDDLEVLRWKHERTITFKEMKSNIEAYIEEEGVIPKMPPGLKKAHPHVAHY